MSISKPIITKHSPELLGVVKSRFAISESSPSGLINKDTGKAVGYRSRHWRVYVGLNGLRAIAANLAVYILSTGLSVPMGYTVSNIDGDPDNLSPDNLECITKADAMFNRKAKSITGKDPRYIGVGYVKRKGLYVGRCKVGGITYGTHGCHSMQECREALNEVRKGLGLATR